MQVMIKTVRCDAKGTVETLPSIWAQHSTALFPPLSTSFSRIISRGRSGVEPGVIPAPTIGVSWC